MNPSLPEAGRYPTSLQAQTPGFVPHNPVTHGLTERLTDCIHCTTQWGYLQLAHVTG